MSSFGILNYICSQIRKNAAGLQSEVPLFMTLLYVSNHAVHSAYITKQYINNSIINI